MSDGINLHITTVLTIITKIMLHKPKYLTTILHNNYMECLIQIQNSVYLLHALPKYLHIT